jgi:microcompartment protein CcmL/EutN
VNIEAVAAAVTMTINQDRGENLLYHHIITHPSQDLHQVMVEEDPLGPSRLAGNFATKARLGMKQCTRNRQS